MFSIKNISGNSPFAEKISEIETECFFENAWSLQSLSSSLEDKNSIFLAAYADGDIIGYVNASCVLDEAELNRICVLEKYRKCGVGDALISELISMLREEDFNVVFLEVRSLNTGAISLYKKHHFVTDTVRKDYYKAPADDALLMSLYLKGR